MNRLGDDPAEITTKEKEEEEVKQQEKKRRLLYMDAANYTRNFFRAHEKWSLEAAQQNVAKFCTAARNSGWTLVAFFDQATLTAEAQTKWRKRREKEVQKGERTVPQGALRLVGEMFAQQQQQGVTVHYSVEMDCDDTIARHAQADGASILSQDRDFLRYVGATYDLYKDYSLSKKKKKRLILIKQNRTKRQSSLRELGPPPKTGQHDAFRDCVSEGTYLRGSPSPLIVQLGNLHIHVRPLRAALYDYLKIKNAVEEEFPVRTANGGCRWDKQAVAPDSTLAHLLYSPDKAVEHFSQLRPAGSSDEDWIKHQFALRSVIAEICCTAMQTTLLDTLKPLTATMEIPISRKKNKKKAQYVSQQRLANSKVAKNSNNKHNHPQKDQSKSKLNVEPLVVNEETRWKPRTLNNAKDDADKIDESDEARDSRLILQLLNKLTPSNVDTLVPAFLSQTTIHLSSDRMQGAIATIVMRASLDSRYTSMHAQLCKRLVDDLPPSPPSSENANEPPPSFRESLVEYCFPGITDPIHHLPVDAAQRMFARRRYIGTNQFLGELYNHHVFTTDDMTIILRSLLKQSQLESAADASNEINELPLEGLCIVLDTCGKLIEADEDAASPLAQELLCCWTALQSLVDNNTLPERRTAVSSRITYLVMDLLELRSLDWCPTRYGTRQRKELVAIPLLEEDRVRRKQNSKRRNKKKKKRDAKVQFAGEP